jgi:hypothetical protein
MSDMSRAIRGLDEGKIDVGSRFLQNRAEGLGQSTSHGALLAGGHSLIYKPSKLASVSFGEELVDIQERSVAHKEDLIQ